MPTYTYTFKNFPNHSIVYIPNTSLQIKQGDVTLTLPITDAFTLINTSRNNGGFQRYIIQGSNLHKIMVIDEYYREGSEPHRFFLRLLNLPNENEIWRYHDEEINLPEPVYKKLIELGTVIQQHRSLEGRPRRPQTRSQTRRQALLGPQVIEEPYQLPSGFTVGGRRRKSRKGRKSRRRN